jgi:hypothetical protein
VPSLRPAAVAITALLLAPAIHAGDISSDLDGRYSVGRTARPAPGLTLLDPSWLLPPIESLDTAAAATDGAERADEILREDPELALHPRLTQSSSAGPLGYALSDDLMAQLRYRHSEPFDRAGSRMLRDDQSTAFSTRPNRDVLDLNMSWRLAGNTVGVGYQLQSARGGALPGEIGVSRFLPGSQQATHALTLGLTREWGAPAPPPLLIEPPPLELQIDLAAVEGTPTPVP